MQQSRGKEINTIVVNKEEYVLIKTKEQRL